MQLRYSLAIGAFAFLCGAGSLHAQDPGALYAKNCKNCHGPAGGEPSAVMKARLNPPKLFDAAFLAKTDDAAFMKAMEKGGQKMKPLADKMSKPEMQAVIKYVRSYAKAGGK